MSRGPQYRDVNLKMDYQNRAIIGYNCGVGDQFSIKIISCKWKETVLHFAMRIADHKI